jgi:hypothetical protein
MLGLCLGGTLHLRWSLGLRVRLKEGSRWG